MTDDQLTHSLFKTRRKKTNFLIEIEKTRSRMDQNLKSLRKTLSRERKKRENEKGTEIISLTVNNWMIFAPDLIRFFWISRFLDLLHIFSSFSFSFVVIFLLVFLLLLPLRMRVA